MSWHPHQKKQNRLKAVKTYHTYSGMLAHYESSSRILPTISSISSGISPSMLNPAALA